MSGGQSWPSQHAKHGGFMEWFDLIVQIATAVLVVLRTRKQKGS